MKKRLWSLVLTLAMVVSMFAGTIVPVSAEAGGAESESPAPAPDPILVEFYNNDGTHRVQKGNYNYEGGLHNNFLNTFGLDSYKLQNRAMGADDAENPTNYAYLAEGYEAGVIGWATEPNQTVPTLTAETMGTAYHSATVKRVVEELKLAEVLEENGQKVVRFYAVYKPATVTVRYWTPADELIVKVSKTFTNPNKDGNTVGFWGANLINKANALAPVGEMLQGWTFTKGGDPIFIPKNSHELKELVDQYGAELKEENGKLYIDTYAVWEPIAYSVAFHANGGEGSMAPQDFVYHQTQSLTANAFTKTGYKFAGWATEADGAAVYPDEYAAKDLTAVYGEVIDLYAVWERNVFTVTLDANGGAVEPAEVSVTYEMAYGKLPVPTKTGWTFMGWMLDSGETVTEDTVVAIADDHTLTAVWTPNTTAVIPAAAAYKVEYYFEQLDGTYVPDEEATLFPVVGELGEEITAADHGTARTGYHLNDVLSVPVVVAAPTTENGELVVTTLKIYYALNEYTVTFDANGGSEVEEQTVKHGGKAVEPAAPARRGYVFLGWYLDELKYDFGAAVTGATVLKAKWRLLIVHVPEEAPSKVSFIDVEKEDYFYEAVEWAVENGITTGITDMEFAPDGICSRAQAVTFLWRAAGRPEAKISVMPFGDVAEGAWYYDAVLWAVENGITKGVSATEFAPDVAVTREQMVTILWRYAKHRNVDVSIGEETNILSYDDAFDIAQYAIPAMQWACGSGTVNGMEDGNGGMLLDPQGITTRAQMVTMLMRLHTDITK